MKYRLLLCALLLFLGSHHNVGYAAQYRPYQKGVSVGFYFNDRPYIDQIHHILDYALALNVDSITIVIPIYMEGPTGNAVFAHPSKTPDDDKIRFFIREAKKEGLTVTLKPLLEESNFPNGFWRGTIAPDNPQQWFESYFGLMTHYANLAQEENADYFVIGVEFQTMVKGKYDSKWIQFIESLRNQAQPGMKLEYHVNWDDTNKIGKLAPAFLPYVDSIGIDAYYELDVEGEITVEKVAKAWNKWIPAIHGVQKLLPDKEVKISEIGIASKKVSLKTTWENARPGDVVDLQLQADYFEAACSALGHLNAGLYFWGLEVDTLENPHNDTSLKFYGKPAADKIRECFAR